MATCWWLACCSAAQDGAIHYINRAPFLPMSGLVAAANFISASYKQAAVKAFLEYAAAPATNLDLVLRNDSECWELVP